MPNFQIHEEILGSDPNRWPTKCLINYPEDFDSEIDQFIECVELATRGEINKSIENLTCINSKALSDWYLNVGQYSGMYRVKILESKSNKSSSGVRLSWPSSREYEVLERDHYLCRYCGIRLIHRNELNKYSKLVGKSNFPNGRRNQDRHGIRMLIQASYDHVNPISSGTAEDKNVFENVISTCWTCNFGKWNYTNEQLGITSPLNFPPQKLENWNGLRDEFIRKS
jgi:5-methylcytosine-specific restriction endonuclease McrA